MEKAILHRLFSGLRAGGLEVRYWDGSRGRYGDGETRVRLVINDPSVLPRRFQ